jgi:hypothetical protein
MRKKTPEQIALYNKNRKEKRRANKEEANKKAREYYHNNIERCRQNGRKNYQKNGERYYQKYTKEKREEFRKRSDEYKLALGCIDCGYKENSLALEFDHVNGKKTRCVSQYNNWDLALLEISKCVVRCANCHRIKTFTNKEHLNRIKNQNGKI